MRTAIFTALLTTILYNNLLYTSENKPPKKSMPTKDWIIAGVVGGGTLELVNVVRKGENYKHIFAFAQRYPGLFIAGTSAFAGLAFLYGEPVKDYFVDHIKNK